MDESGPSIASLARPVEVALPLYHFSPHKGVPIGSGHGPNTFGSWTPLRSSDLSAPLTMPTELAVLTYNIFQSSDLYHPVQRTHAILSTLRNLCSPSPTFQPPRPKADVICLQEVSPDFEAMLRRERCLQRDWTMTDLRSVQAAFGKPPVSPLLPAQGSNGKRKAGQQDDTNSWDDGIMMLVRKTWLAGYLKAGKEVVVKALPFADSMQNKGLLVLDVLPSSGRSKVRIATAHFDSLPENAPSRTPSFAQTLAHLSSPSSSSSDAPAIIAADFNHSSYAELEGLLESFVDVEWTAKAPSAVAVAASSETDEFWEEEGDFEEDVSLDNGASTSLDAFRSFPTFGHLFPYISLPSSRSFSRGRGRPFRGRGRGRGSGRSPPHRKPRRTDLVLSSLFPSLEVLRVERVGTDPVRWGKGPMKGQEVREDEGKEGKLWASDHEGVLVTLRLPNE